MKKGTLSFTAGLLTGAVLFSGGAAYAAGIMAEHAPQTAYVDGAPVQMDAYSIGGYNYVKLRDIGQMVDFNVYWDGRSVQIDSDAPYTGEAPIGLTDNLEIRQEMIRLINQTRKANGVPELSVNEALMNAAQVCSDRRYTWHHSQEECQAARTYGYPHGFGSNLTVFTGVGDSDAAQPVEKVCLKGRLFHVKMIE